METKESPPFVVKTGVEKQEKTGRNYWQ